MILADFTCPYHGRFEALADRDAESMPCPMPTIVHRHANDGSPVICGEPNCFPVPCPEVSPWSPSPVHGRVRIGEVERGANEQPASPMYLSTQDLGNGMPYSEWRAKRDRMYEERRHKESKDL